MYLDRPRLAALLDDAATRPLTAVLAGPGFGKSTLLRAWADGRHACGHALGPADRDLARFARSLLDALRTRVPGLPADLITAAEGSQGPLGDDDPSAKAAAFADHLAEALDEKLVRELVLVLDDLHEIDEAPGPRALLAGLVRHSVANLRVVVASRHDPPFPVERLRGQGAYAEVLAADLAYTIDETDQLLGRITGEADPALAAALHRATRGWPAAVRMAAEVLRGLDGPARLAHLQRLPDADGPLYRYLTQEALAGEGEATQSLLKRLAVLPRLHPGLVAALDGTTPAAAAQWLRGLARGAIWVEHSDEPGWYGIPEIACSILREGAVPSAADLRTAAEWYEGEGDLPSALIAWRLLDDDDGVAGFVRTRGGALLASGRVTDVVEAIESLPAARRDLGTDLLLAEALLVRGDWEGAGQALRRHAAGDGPVPAEVAWRLGIIHHLRGELDDAADAYGRGTLDGQDPVNESLLLAWQASVAWLRGEADRCAALTADALSLATESGDDRALATAHTVAAMEAALRSDRAANDSHYLRALDHATAARDVLLTIRIRANRGSRMVEEGLFQEAILELDDAIELAELTGYTLFQALSLSNRGEALLALGELEAAGRDLTASRRLYERLGSRMVSYPLGHLGSVLATRGDLAQARAAFEEAIASAEAVGDLQGLVPPLAGLAVCLAEEDPVQAAALADRALAAGPVLGRVRSLVAASDVALAAGRHPVAEAHATEAATVARQRRDRAGLAEALERLAVLQPRKAPELLDEAASVWASLRAPVGTARVELGRIELGLPPASDPSTRALQAEAIADRMRRMGCRRLASRATELAARCRDDARPELEVDTLGGFGLRRHGVAVPVTAWQSRKARDLLKILICSRGAVPRDQLLDVLWPDEDPDRAGRRLSVALSTLRAVLDPDKERPADHVVVADGGSIRLDRAHASIDVDRFLELSDAALAMAEGDPARRTALAAADALYTGELLSEDVYEEWAVALRERARDTYVRVARALARHATQAGDHDAAVRALLSLLERDQFDEAAHLALVQTLAAAGRHGESRRAYRTYCDRMGELEVEAVPYPT